MTLPLPRAYDFRLIPIALIDEPDIAMRESMDERALEELAHDIKANGLRQPIGVRPIRDRFRVSYGHRRRLACAQAGEHVIPCLVLADDDVEEQTAKMAENWFREEVNPAEEATFFAHLLEHRFHGDIERLCTTYGVKESLVNGRLDLLRGDPDVLDALRNRRISLTVARELNRVKVPEYRALFLDDAVRLGSTAMEVQTRRMNLERMAKVAELGERPDIANAAASTESPIASADACLLCALPGDSLEMDYVRVHRDCLTSLRRRQRAELATPGA